MTDKKTQSEPSKNPQLTDEEADKISGGMMPRGGAAGGAAGGSVSNAPPSCTETTDTGMMGCPG